MNCRACKVDKLSREYPQEPLTDECDHPEMVCMRCVLKLVQQEQICPNPGCNAAVPLDSPGVKDIELRLRRMFFTYKPEHVNIPAPNPGDAHANIRIATLTGESIVIPYQASMTIYDLKKMIRQKAGYEESKQRLKFRGKDLDVRRNDGGLAQLKDYGVQPHQTIHLVVLLYAIPERFNHVIFDLFWGYPTKGQDFLDATCLAFSGTELSFECDYVRRLRKSVWHSGDVMDDAKRIGHHTIEVKLKEVPPTITHLFFTLSAWNSPNISRYKNPSLKFFESSDRTKDLCTTSFNHAQHSQAVIMCFVSRRGGSWEIFDSGKLSAGNARNYDPLVSTIQSIIQEGV